MTKDELAQFLSIEEIGWDLDNLIASANGEIQQLMLPTWAKELHATEGISNLVYKLLVELVAEADDILLQEHLYDVWEALLWNPDDTKDQLIAYIRDAQDTLSKLVGERPGYFHKAEPINRPKLIPNCPHGVQEGRAHAENETCVGCGLDCNHYIPF